MILLMCIIMIILAFLFTTVISLLLQVRILKKRILKGDLRIINQHRLILNLEEQLLREGRRRYGN
jgi:predicted Holliday junction resolvase-like endonuclease